MYSCSSFVENFTFFIGIEPARGNDDDNGDVCDDGDDIVANVLFLRVALIPFKENPPSISNEDHWHPYYCTFSMLSTLLGHKVLNLPFYKKKLSKLSEVIIFMIE